MPTAAPHLAPLFRSDAQMRLLAEIFYGSEALSGSELARRTGIPQQTVARELARLEQAGLVVTKRVGTAKVVSPDERQPFHQALRQLLGYVGGIIPTLRAAYEDNEQIREVFIFGSWARRFHGEPGPPPNDIDIAVVSDTLSRFDLAEQRMAIESATGMSIDQFVFTSDNERLPSLRDGSVVVLQRP